MKRTITPDDILPAAEYAAQRKASRERVAALKRNRRVEVGPFATFYFESWDTVRHQIQEMLHIEKGGAEQLAEEIEAYAPLIPQPGELVATVMFEIEDELRRKTALQRIGGIENHAFLRIGDIVVRADPDPNRENTSPDGKASSVQFFHFRLPPKAVEEFKQDGGQIQLGFDHSNYGHIAVLPESVRQTLAEDLG
jgi:hypothetical protein